VWGKNKKMTATTADLIPLSLRINFPEDHTLCLTVHPNATIQDIKTSISDSSESLSYTNFDLSYNGQTCDPRSDVKSINQSLTDFTLDLLPKMYNEHEIRVHLCRFREIMTFFESPSQMHGYEASKTLFPEIKESDVLSFDKIEDRTISNLYPLKKTDLCSNLILKSIEMSGWNPPSFSQKMMGDLLYLKIETLEGQVCQVTASTKGFYLNNSTDSAFAPGKTGQIFNTLPGLLSGISPKFSDAYPALQSALLKREPYEFLMPTYPVYPWLVSRDVLNYNFDHGRTLDSLLMASDLLDTLACRDWNEDLQSARELPKSTVQECVVRDQAISKAHSDFVDSAVRGAIGIVHESIPQVEPSQSVYIHNNIFFSQISDHLEHFEKYGGFDAAHVGVSKDIDGMKIVSALDTAGLFTVGGAVIDYKGIRTVAQTIVPGIIKKNSSGDTSVIYGLSGADKHLVFDQEIHDELKKINEFLNLEEHIVVSNRDGMQTSIFTSLDSKGVMGSDSRKYLLDLYRMTPLDICFLENSKQDSFGPYPHQLTLIRPELIEIYKEKKIGEILKERQVCELYSYSNLRNYLKERIRRML
jgi:protein TIF31